MKTVNEQKLKERFQVDKAKDFYREIERYDNSMIPIMKARGYRCIRSAERTVAFTFGEITFSRRKWKKGKKWVCPVDEYLGLEKNARYSKELVYQIAELATMMTYESVVRVLKMTYHVHITKPTVVKVVKMANELIEQYEEYQYYQEELAKDKKVSEDLIYIEGDGVCIKVSDEEGVVHNREFAHFIVHTGSKEIESNRWALQNKKSFISMNNAYARRKVLDYLHQNIQIDEKTVLITNSDGGKGYSPYIFREFAKALRVKRHEHFWDIYHVNKEIERMYRFFPRELKNQFYQAIQQHDKKLLRTVLDTTESLIDVEEEERFSQFSKRFLSQFQYTKTPKMRGFDYLSLGTMESQHRKITYRMKKKGMVWTPKGANAMTNMILWVKEGRLRDLFFGSWREEYQEYKVAEELTAGQIRLKQNRLKRQYEWKSQAKESLKQEKLKNNR
ncbi:MULTISPECIES: ISLre2 family transposase [unclassified Streptococcus]|uniref:ISLre2 family transposase n=1 Tax=unclassified Streptococcus TaxID=2608887 RepID=UPI00211AB4F1|nr:MULTISPECIES: ISLre2 family transposase [unclassified Streptococcus]MCQ9212417.1 ISLre2 family transposase [Streptococcus sp. B01]MCQ9213755.1 ISLre2 family transposase [Streptococcus sp. O1]MCQ9214485.1 ISLre2 family transposase [Streptococcus sp. O1]